MTYWRSRYLIYGISRQRAREMIVGHILKIPLKLLCIDAPLTHRFITKYHLMLVWNLNTSEDCHMRLLHLQCLFAHERVSEITRNVFTQEIFGRVSRVLSNMFLQFISLMCCSCFTYYVKHFY